VSDRPLVSAVIIFFNEEKYIQEAVESVFAQTYDHWELLLVDDGSDDKSTGIARRYAEEHPAKVRYLEHRDHANLGMSASRNVGVRSARGRYLAFLDGDDVWLAIKLEEQVAILEAHPDADMVYAPLQMWHSWKDDVEDLPPDHLYGVGKDGKHPYADSLVDPPKLLALFLKREEYIPSGFLVKRDRLAQFGVYEEAFRDSFSDAVALVKLCLISKVYVSSKVWYLYRKHEASYTYLFWLHGQQNEEDRVYLEWVEAYFDQKEVHDPELRTVLRNLLFRCRHRRFQRLERRVLQCKDNALNRVVSVARRAFGSGK